MGGVDSYGVWSDPEIIGITWRIIVFFHAVVEKQGSQVILEGLSLGVGSVEGRMVCSEGVVG